MPYRLPSGARATTTGIGPSFVETTWPGANSLARHTTCFISILLGARGFQRRQPVVDGAGVVVVDLATQLSGQIRRQGLERRVEVPVRIVGGEADQLIGLHLLYQCLDLRCGELLHWLGCETHLLADDVAW